MTLPGSAFKAAPRAFVMIAMLLGGQSAALGGEYYGTANTRPTASPTAYGFPWTTGPDARSVRACLQQRDNLSAPRRSVFDRNDGAATDTAR